MTATNNQTEAVEGGSSRTTCSASEVDSAFRAELQALLDKWGAELEAKDHWQGYAECGEDIRITVDIPGIWNADHDCLREYVEIDLGSRLSPQNETSPSVGTTE